jgi:hypothetical protein
MIPAHWLKYLKSGNIPALYSTEGQEDPMVYAVFIQYKIGWRFFLTEWDSEETAFGLVEGYEHELGYFDLAELAEGNTSLVFNAVPAPLSVAAGRVL